jgi:hypothetical protein
MLLDKFEKAEHVLDLHRPEPISTLQILHMAWQNGGLVSPGALLSETRKIDLAGDLLTIIMAEIFQYPMHKTKVLESAGRFALVAYEPIKVRDPEMIICLEMSPAGRMFNHASLKFQEAREWYRDLSDWYKQAKKAAANLIPPLAALEPSAEEAELVLRKALWLCAAGRTIQGRALPGGLPSMERFREREWEELDHVEQSLRRVPPPPLPGGDYLPGSEHVWQYR